MLRACPTFSSTMVVSGPQEEPWCRGPNATDLRAQQAQPPLQVHGGVDGRRLHKLRQAEIRHLDLRQVARDEDVEARGLASPAAPKPPSPRAAQVLLGPRGGGPDHPPTPWGDLHPSRINFRHCWNYLGAGETEPTICGTVHFDL